MAPTKKSIYRQAGAQHFQLVHRSVRDPLINDPEASQQVFKQIGRYNESNNEYKVCFRAWEGVAADDAVWVLAGGPGGEPRQEQDP